MTRRRCLNSVNAFGCFHSRNNVLGEFTVALWGDLHIFSLFYMILRSVKHGALSCYECWDMPRCKAGLYWCLGPVLAGWPTWHYIWVPVGITAQVCWMKVQYLNHWATALPMFIFILFYFHFISFQFSFCFINIWIRGYFSGLSWLVGWQEGQLVCKTSDTSSPQWFFFERPLGYVAWLEVISRKIGWLNTNWH